MSSPTSITPDALEPNVRSLLELEGVGPSIVGQLRRPRLLRRLAAATDNAVTMLAAPAGAGKSTILAQWAEETSGRCAWLCLEARHNNPSTLLKSLVVAAQRLAPDIEFDVDGVLALHGDVDLEWALASLVIKPLSSLSSTAYLILDDYHTVDDEVIHRALGWLMMHQPPHLRLIVSSRSVPPIRALARLRALGSVTVVDDRDLRFSIDEVRAFCQLPGSQPLSESQVQLLEARTEGWAVGLRLFSLALSEHSSPEAVLEHLSGAERDFTDYFWAEVLEQQPEHAQTFLLHTAALDRFTPELCRAVVPPESSELSLDEVRAQNLFLVPIDNRNRWFRYHHLFAAMLRRRAARVLGPKAVASVHRRASEWYATHDLWDEAIAHAARAEEPRWHADLIRRWYASLLNVGDDARLSRWVEAFHADELQRFPGLRAIASVTALLRGGIARAEALLDGLDAAIREHESDEDRRRHDLALASFGRSLYALQTGSPELVPEIGAATVSLLVPRELSLRSAQRVVTGMAQLATGDLDAAEVTWTQAVDLAQAAGNHFGALVARGGLCQLRRGRGSLRKAARDCEAGIAYAELHRCTLNSGAAALKVQLGLIKLDAGEVDEAGQLIDEALAVLRYSPFSPVLASGYAAMARVLLARGCHEDAAVAIDEASLLVRMQHSPAAYAELATAKEALDRARVTPSRPASAPTNTADSLTPRERQVLDLAARGLTNRDIAGELSTAVGTIKRHMHHIIAKLGANNRTEAVFLARELDLLPS